MHEECIRSVLERRPDLRRAQLEKTRDLKNRNARDSPVIGYEGLIDGLSLPDPDDRHGPAAAIHAGAQVIVTFNLSDFPSDARAAHGIEGRHPDDFCCELLNTSPGPFLDAVRLQRLSLKSTGRTAIELRPEA
jgi:hypothetical protein